MDTPCDIYPGKPNSSGYGNHRQVWIRANGPIPPGMQVLHHCDNRACRALDHLFLGTQSDNLHDMVSKGRHWLQQRPADALRGAAHGRARLTEADVREARRLRADGWSWPRLAARYGVRHYTVQLAVAGKTWQHVH